MPLDQFPNMIMPDLMPSAAGAADNSMPSPTDNPISSLNSFNVIIPKPFKLSEQPKEHLDKIRDEVLDKIRTWERRCNTFFAEYISFCDSWRVKPRTLGNKKPMGLYNSKSGETHRAAETLATLWTRMMTATDPFFEAVAEGLDDFGIEITPELLYASERVLLRQLRKSKYKEKIARAGRSVALMGTVIFEEPFVSIPAGFGPKRFEYTDFVFRSLLKTAYDTTVYDIELSDFVAVIDFHTKWRLRNMATSDDENWDLGAIEKHISDGGEFKNNLKTSTNVYNRVRDSKQRAGYIEIDQDIFEKITYHGRIMTDNPVVGAYWDSEGRQDDPNYVDFTVGILNGDSVIQFHLTQNGDWHSRFKVATFKSFEDEPRGYGICSIGKRAQREQDITISR